MKLDKEYIRNFFFEICMRIKNEGILVTIIYILKSILFKFFYFNIFLILFKDTNDFSISQQLPKKVHVEVLKKFKKSNLENKLGPLTISKFMHRFDDGAICMVCYENNSDIVYYTWMNLNKGGIVGIQKDEAYFLDSYTLPKYRNRGIHTAMCLERLNFIKLRGYKRAIIAVALLNLSARRVLISKINFKLKGILFYFKFLKKEFKYSKPYLLTS